jgi:DNA-binding CsgD family transcriptional regulator
MHHDTNKPWQKFHAQINEVCKPFNDYCKLNYFGHSHIQPLNGKYFTLATDPSAAEYYHSEKGLPPSGYLNFHEIQSGVYFPTTGDPDKKFGWMEGSIKKFREKFGISNPALVVNKQGNYADLYLFSVQSKNVYELFCNNFDIVENFLFYYKENAKNIIDNAKVLMIKSDVIHPTLSSKGSMTKQKNYFNVNQYWLTINNQQTCLTAREYEIIASLADGLSSKQTGAKLYCSGRTVEKHIENLKIKLGASRRTDLISLFEENRIK